MLWRAGGGSTSSRHPLLRFPQVVLFTCSPSLVLFPVLRLACRDIGGSDPERMASPRVADYVQELFKDSPVQVESNINTTCANSIA